MTCFSYPREISEQRGRYDDQPTDKGPDAISARIGAAAELRARFNLKTPDALHLAAAQCHGCEALWTHDNRLDQASRGLATILL